jgi:polyhydroxyalkanoate synthesis regulator phasin
MDFNDTDCKNPAPLISDFAAANKENFTALNALICKISQESIIRDNGLAAGLYDLSASLKTLMDVQNTNPEQMQQMQALIDANAEKINALVVASDANQAATEANKAATETNKALADANTVLGDKLRADLTTLMEGMNGVKDDLSALTDRVSTLESEVEALKNRPEPTDNACAVATVVANAMEAAAADIRAWQVQVCVPAIGFAGVNLATAAAPAAPSTGGIG